MAFQAFNQIGSDLDTPLATGGDEELGDTPANLSYIENVKVAQEFIKDISTTTFKNRGVTTCNHQKTLLFLLPPPSLKGCSKCFLLWDSDGGLCYPLPPGALHFLSPSSSSLSLRSFILHCSPGCHPSTSALTASNLSHSQPLRLQPTHKGCSSSPTLCHHC
jgi:hypothetical protein